MEPKRKQYLYVNEAMRNKTNNKEHCLKTQQLKKDGKICYLAIMTKDKQDVLLLSKMEEGWTSWNRCFLK